MNIFIGFFIAVVIVEAITEIVTKSEIFLPFRQMLFNLGLKRKMFMWIHNLFDCGYCFSVWSAGLVSALFMYASEAQFGFINWFVLTLLLHRLSNMFHNIMDKLTR